MSINRGLLAAMAVIVLTILNNSVTAMDHREQTHKLVSTALDHAVRATQYTGSGEFELGASHAALALLHLAAQPELAANRDVREAASSLEEAVLFIEAGGTEFAHEAAADAVDTLTELAARQGTS